MHKFEIGEIVNMKYLIGYVSVEIIKIHIVITRKGTKVFYDVLLPDPELEEQTFRQIEERMLHEIK
jgi:hypothetical protein